jgi:hypothetical protein
VLEAEPPPLAGHSRGALFRVAYRVLGSRLGADWVAQLTRGKPGLAEVLNPSLAPMSWQPVRHLIALLEESRAAIREAQPFAMAIGRATMTATFSRFFGADPRNVPTLKVLRAAERYWSRYHTWGRVTSEATGPAACTLVVHGSPGEPLLCAMVQGCFARIAELSGAADVVTAHPACVGDGHAACTFTVAWRETGAAAEPPSRPPARRVARG